MFDDAKSKVKRADHHIKHLNSVIDALFKTDFYNVHVEKEPDTGNNVVKFKMNKPLPCEVPLILGDAIHNLRASLDIMAFEMVKVAGEVPDKYVAFPVRENRQEVESAINGGKIRACGPDVVSCIVDKIQPYKGGNDAIHSLHSLDILDKHRLLIPVASVVALRGVSGRFGTTTLENCSFEVDARGVLQMHFGPGEVTIVDFGQPAIAILFDHGQPFERQPVLPTLHQLLSLVAASIQTVEETFLARDAAKDGNTT